MHINEIVQLLADYGGTLTCKKGNDGSVYITASFPQGELLDQTVETAGFDIEAVMSSVKTRIDRIVKFRGHIPVTQGKKTKEV